MPNVARLLKDEIARVARKEIRAQTSALQRSVATYRREIAALKRRDVEMQRALAALTKGAGRAAPATPVEAGSTLRFRADGFKTLRRKLELSAEQVALLLNVSGQSVYAWEQKRSTPRRSMLPAIAALRNMGKREAQQRLSEIKAASGGAGSQATKRKPRGQGTQKA